MTNIAYLRIEKGPEYRFNAFYEGLIAAGYTTTPREPRSINPGDVLVMWNRGGTNETFGSIFEKAGGTVLVAENGYIGADENGHQLYAIAKGGHNGSGTWYQGGSERWKELNIELQPYRKDGSHVLLCPNRFIGSKVMRMPLGYAEFMTTRLNDLTKRPIHIRPHPGNWQVNPPKTPLEDDLRNAWAVGIWSSSSGVRALVSGIPVFYFAPYWIASDAADNDITHIENPVLKDRLPAFEKLAWAQWTLNEIRKGLPFYYLLQHEDPSHR